MVAVAIFLVLGPFVGAFDFAFVPLEEGEEGFLAVRRDGFFLGDSSSLLSALGLRRDTLGIGVIVRLCGRAPVCLGQRVDAATSDRGLMFWVCNEINLFDRDALLSKNGCCGCTIYGGWKVVQRK